MRALPWDRVISGLSLLIAVLSWFVPDATIGDKFLLSLTFLWFTAVAISIFSERISEAWALLSLGLILALIVLVYYFFATAQPLVERRIVYGFVLLGLAVLAAILAYRKTGDLLRERVKLQDIGMLGKINISNDARELFFSGLTLDGVLHARSELEELLKRQDCRLHILLPTEAVVLNGAPQFFSAHEPRVRLYEDYKAHLTWLTRIAHQKGEAIQIRTTDVLPTMSVLLIDPHSRKSRIRLSFYTSTGQPNERPYLDIDKETNANWYGYFATNLLDLWDKSSVWNTGAKAELARSRERLQNKL